MGLYLGADSVVVSGNAEMKKEQSQLSQACHQRLTIKAGLGHRV